jgi:hypothetical protein
MDGTVILVIIVVATTVLLPVGALIWEVLRELTNQTGNQSK